MKEITAYIVSFSLLILTIQLGFPENCMMEKAELESCCVENQHCEAHPTETEKEGSCGHGHCAACIHCQNIQVISSVLDELLPEINVKNIKNTMSHKEGQLSMFYSDCFHPPEISS